MNAEDDLVMTGLERERKWRFDLVLPVLFRPRKGMGQVVESSRPTWRTPLVLLIVAAVVAAVVAGSIKAAAAATGELTLPPNFEFLTPEQQAQFQQAATATNNPTFNYVLPALGAAVGVLIIWLLIGGLLHLVLTVIGGRGSSRTTLSIAAWAALPALLRYGVQIVAMLMTDQLVAAPGLAGFAPPGEGVANALLAGMLSHVDIYLLWQILLLVIGVRLSSRLSITKSVVAVIVTVIVVLALRALPTAILAQFGDLTIIQPFL
jgi:hypothetical protein